MAIMVESAQEGKWESWEELIANIEADIYPMTSMRRKTAKPVNTLHNWQVEIYPDVDQKGVPEGKDADSFNSVGRERVQSYVQRLWHNVGVGKLANDVVKVHSVKDEMARQVAIGMKLLKRKIEMRLSSSIDARADDGIRGYETRGSFAWLNPSHTSILTVPTAFETPAAQRYSGTLADLKETTFQGLCDSAFKQRRGAKKLKGYVGIDLKSHVDYWNSYQDVEVNKVPVRQVSTKDVKTILAIVDRLAFSSADIDLIPTTWLLHDIDGAETASTHKSGLVLSEEMWGMNYVESPQVTNLEYRGGGYKAICECTILNQCFNPLGDISLEIAS